MPTYRLLVEYDGGPFAGWQVQPGKPTVQQSLETALQTALRETVTLVGSGRTDAGVHARGQVAHFACGRAHEARRLQQSLNSLTPGSVAVLAAEQAPDSFHARYDARARRYVYAVSTSPRALDRATRLFLRPEPDVDRMNEAAARLPGMRDFSAFCRTRSETRNRVCTIETARWEPEARPGDWRFVIEADRFLHGMVRAIVGTLLRIGHGDWHVADMDRIIASSDRRAAGPAAPAHGLCLDRVRYAAPIFAGSSFEIETA